MHIESLNLKNFKKWNELGITFNESMNVIIGKNNSGKTTILEGLLLWKKCYDNNILARGRGFYSVSRNLSFSDLPFLRINSDSDLFYNNSREISISIILKHDNTTYNLGFIIKRPTQIKNTYLQVHYKNPKDFEIFYEELKNMRIALKNVISISFSSPLAKIPAIERYLYKPQIKKEIEIGNSRNVLRNKIVSESSNIINMQDILSRIFNNKIQIMHNRYVDDISISVNLVNDQNKSEVGSYGSGVLQILELFSNFEFIDSLLHIALADEPDAHIHESLQDKLIDEFRKQDNTQFFIVSHNINFIDKFKENEKIFICEDKKASIVCGFDINNLKIINELRGKVSETEKLKNAEVLVFVEGKDDIDIFNKLLNKYMYINKLGSRAVYFVPLNGVDGYINKINVLVSEFKKHLQIKNTYNILIMDSDFLSTQEKDNNIKKINKPIDTIYYQDGLCLESVLFSDKNRFIQLIKAITNINDSKIENIILKVVKDFYSNLKNSTSEEFKILDKAFVSNRNRTNKGIKEEYTISNFIQENANKKLRFLLTKVLVNRMLKKIELEIEEVYNKKYKLDSKVLLSEYIENINSNNDFYDFHLEIIKNIITNSEVK